MDKNITPLPKSFFDKFSKEEVEKFGKSVRAMKDSLEKNIADHNTKAAAAQADHAARSEATAKLMAALKETRDANMKVITDAAEGFKNTLPGQAPKFTVGTITDNKDICDLLVAANDRSKPFPPDHLKDKWESFKKR